MSLLFFDDILVYSATLQDHWKHLELVFQIMRKNQMFLKATKCDFAQAKVEYLGHFISAQGIETDSRKIEVVSKWPVPQSLKELRSFLGLAGYYRKFIPDYAIICRPLHDLLKKDGFLWNSAAQNAFVQLKEALVKATILAVPDFGKQFVVETDASSHGIGAVLMQEQKISTPFQQFWLSKLMG